MPCTNHIGIGYDQDLEQGLELGLSPKTTGTLHGGEGLDEGVC